MAAEQSDAGGAGSAAAAAADEWPTFLSLSVAERRAEVEAWNVQQADCFCASLQLRPLGVSGRELWNIHPSQIATQFDPSGKLICAVRSDDFAQRLNEYGRGNINAAAQFARDAAAAAAASHGASGAAAASPSASVAAAASSSSASSAMRGPDSVADSAAATFAGSSVGDEQDSKEVSLEERRWTQWQRQQRQVHRTAAASSASAAPSTALFRELPSSSNDPTPRAEPLRIDSLPQEWFVDPVPGALVCCICTEVARDPPNLEVCGHAVCRECLTQHRRRSSNCPVCRQSFADSKLASQPFAQSMVWQLRVRCLQHEKGCGWQGPLGTDSRNLKLHDAECAVKQAMCRLCDKVCTAEEKADHPKLCPLRMVECASCQQSLHFCNLADHHPAIASGASMDLTADEGEAAPSSSASSATAAAPAAASSSSSGGAATGAAAAASDLLPPLVPPCNFSEACPRGCEDPKQPGRVNVYRQSQRLAHERTCTQRPVSCTLCFPAHFVSPRQLVAHIGAVMGDSQRCAFAQQQIAQNLTQRSAPAAPAAAATVATAASSSSSSAVALPLALCRSFTTVITMVVVRLGHLPMELLLSAVMEKLAGQHGRRVVETHKEDIKRFTHQIVAEVVAEAVAEAEQEEEEDQEEEEVD